MHVDLSKLSPNRAYFTLIQAVIPRPIAWVLSNNANDTLNLAPFSYFNMVCSDPPLLMLSIGKKRDGSLKDTRRNIIERTHFVVHIPQRVQVAAVNESSRELPFGQSELNTQQLATELFEGFPLPRLSACPIALGCSLHQFTEIGPQQQALILGLIETMYIDDAIVDEDANGRIRIDPIPLDPLSRLGGDDYGALSDVLRLPRPR